MRLWIPGRDLAVWRRRTDLGGHYDPPLQDRGNKELRLAMTARSRWGSCTLRSPHRVTQQEAPVLTEAATEQIIGPWRLVPTAIWLTEIEGRPATLIDANFFGVAMRTEMEIREYLYKDLVPEQWRDLVNSFEFTEPQRRRR
jgi:hypothetical protein